MGIFPQVSPAAAAVRLATASAAAACAAALDGRYFAGRTLRASLDRQGGLTALLPRGTDDERRLRFGSGGGAEPPGGAQPDTQPDTQAHAEALEASRAVLAAAAAAGAPFVACASYVSELPRYTYRQGPDGPGYYRHAGAPLASDPREQSLGVLRQAAAAAAAFVRCDADVGAVPGYVFGEGGEGVGYYRHKDAPPPDEVEYSIEPYPYTYTYPYTYP